MARLQLQSALRNPLNAVFGVDANVVVLRELARHGGALAASEIVDRSGASKSSIRLGLLALEQLGLVVSEGTRTTRLHRFNRDHYFAPTIEALFEAETQRFQNILDAVRQAAGSLPEVASLCLFGSAATGVDRVESDLDILLVVAGPDVGKPAEMLRERLRPAASSLGFNPSVTGLSIDDVGRLQRDHDPWWQEAIGQFVVLAGDHPEVLTGKARRRAGG
ncbi:hypothetical protein ASC71_02755 [Rhizobium sp. Root1240]|uniref:helix-turn-helix domain-containing protein n=1 Tax=unclassified Rhizobium TaxID=2613769 RepID=UPI0007123C31|nr:MULTISPECIES: helix-turn-helix domain-containing protein [unclassified Rhizobium]KQW31213.1 hypothetical protein ASC71_02755 [Rhizobium sp. Root1240]